jgi:hypothetical protein
MRLAALWFPFALVSLLALSPAHEVRARPPMVPQEMIDACDSLAEGAACSFVLSKHTIAGKCALLPDQVLACRPGGTTHKKKPTTAASK